MLKFSVVIILKEDDRGDVILQIKRACKVRYITRGGAQMKTTTFDSIRVGDALEPVVRSVTQETFWKFSVASLDYNPVHNDQEWVKTAQPFGIDRTVGHGMMTIAFMMSVVSNWAYPSMLMIRKSESKLIFPVLAGWTVTCTGIIAEKHVICPGKNYVVIDLEAKNQDGQLLGVCKAEVVFPD
jgi:3-hydroxybutyryl-CoA dehydratase